MASSLKVDIVSAENEIWSGDAKLVSASAQMGEVGIAPGHAAFITRIKPGEVRIQPADESAEIDIYVSGGIMEVQPYVVTIMADTAIRVEELDEASAEKAKAEAEAALAEAGAKPGEVDYKAIQAQLAEASAQLQLIKKLRR